MGKGRTQGSRRGAGGQVNGWGFKVGGRPVDPRLMSPG